MALLGLIEIDAEDGTLEIDCAVAAMDKVSDDGFRQVNNHVDPFAYVISANIHRRHLTAEDKRRLVEAVIKAKPEASDRTIAEQTKTPRSTVRRIRKAVTGGPSGPREGKDGKTYTAPARAPVPPDAKRAINSLDKALRKVAVQVIR